MKEGKIPEYILASCNLPLFKMEKFIDDKFYIDGGFFDNNPINMLLDKGYDKVYSIEIQGIGFTRRIKDKSKVVKITPSRFLGSTLNVNKSKINENIKLGYYDTLKVLKSYDGYNYIFKHHSDFWYNSLVRFVNEELLERVKKYFKVKSNRELVLKSLEYCMMKEDSSYFKVYGVYKEIRNLRKSKNKHFVYEFIKKLKFL